MSLLSRKIADAVDKQPGPGEVTVAEGRHRISLQLTATSPLGVALDALEYIDEGATNLSSVALRAWAKGLTERLTYLMEPLVLLELDDEAGVAELRSKVPSTRENARSYYEVRIDHAGTIRLRRITFDASDRRRNSVPCQLTREALERLVDDLVETRA